MSCSQVGLDQRTVVGVLGQEVDMHLVGADLGALMAEMGEIEGDGVVLGLAERERNTPPVVVAADEDIVHARQSRAADQAVDAVQIAPPGGPPPIVEGLGEGRLGADESRLVGRAELVKLGSFYFAHPHGCLVR